MSREQPKATCDVDVNESDIRGGVEQFSARVRGRRVQFSERRWDRLHYQGRRFKDYYFATYLTGVPEPFCELFWQNYKNYWAARGNWLPWLIYYTEPQPRSIGLFKRKDQSRRDRRQLFEDLDPRAGIDAVTIFYHLRERWKKREILHPERSKRATWRKPILVGAARRLARNPQQRSSEWGRRMRRIKGGVHVQRRYRQQGWHPLPSVRKAWGLTADRPVSGVVSTLHSPKL